VTVDLQSVARRAVGGPVREVVVVASRYATSHATAEVDVVRPDGTVVELLFKDLAPAGLLPEAAGHRPPFLDDPRREVEVYEAVLAGAGLGTARCVAAGGPDGEPWLLLERVRGAVLWQVGEIDVWCDVARWAARLHLAPLDAATSPRLLTYDRAYFERWPRRARRHLAAGDGAARTRLDRVLARYGDVVEALVALPLRLVHGELYASNVVVDAASGRVCAVDWEMAGVGPAVLDLAALVAGDWDESQRAPLLHAYHGALPAERRGTLAELATDVTRARLHQCLQWLGWSPGWEPPAAHGRDWLATALECTEELGL
jgi:Ser/Thr protein kinase RdoA (MazF antagonist)